MGNWPGVTVERRSGSVDVPVPGTPALSVEVVDLPGTYSLSARTEDERIAAACVAEPEVDVIVNVLDASNLERNLFLTTQLLELRKPMVFALNMVDDARKQGMEFNLPALSVLLGGPVVGTVGNRGEGIEELKAALGRTLLGLAPGADPEFCPVGTTFGPELEAELAKLAAEIARDERLAETIPARTLALRLFDGAPDSLALAEASHARKAIQSQLAASARLLETRLGADPETLLTEHRYGFAKGLVKEVLKPGGSASALSSTRLDRVLTHRLWGIPLFLGIMVAVYTLTFVLGAIPQGWIRDGFAWLQGVAATHLPAVELTSLLADGIIPGVGSVVVFLPVIMILMGCNAPAIQATRTIESKSDRLITILVNPLISCSARLLVYILLAGAFFSPFHGARVVVGMHVLGFVLAILMGKVLRLSLFRKERTPFVMELPPYRLPVFRTTLLHMWEKGSVFQKKTGTVIFAGATPVSRHAWVTRSSPSFGRSSIPTTPGGKPGRTASP